MHSGSCGTARGCRLNQHFRKKAFRQLWDCTGLQTQPALQEESIQTAVGLHGAADSTSTSGRKHSGSCGTARGCRLNQHFRKKAFRQLWDCTGLQTQPALQEESIQTAVGLHGAAESTRQLVA
ncbi:hypothetical protein ACOMHN_020409 [Nucella lapillus]